MKISGQRYKHTPKWSSSFGHIMQLINVDSAKSKCMDDKNGKKGREYNSSLNNCPDYWKLLVGQDAE